MTKVIYNRQHVTEYFLYGGISGLLFGGTVWYLLADKRYADNWIIHFGSILFFFVIMMYAIRLTHRKQDLKSSWTMLFAGMGAVLVGVAVATLFSAILCLIYLPESFAKNPIANVHDQGVLGHIFFTSILETFSAGGFAAVLVAYVIKPDQTTDETADY